MRTSTILKAISCPHLALFAGPLYWVFQYDTLDEAGSVGVYDTHSVYTPRLSDMDLDAWVEIGKEFAAKMEARNALANVERDVQIAALADIGLKSTKE